MTVEPAPPTVPEVLDNAICVKESNYDKWFKKNHILCFAGGAGVCGLYIYDQTGQRESGQGKSDGWAEAGETWGA